MQTATIDETLEQRLGYPEYKRWLKAGMCLNCVKEGLDNFAQKESEDLYKDILTTVGAKPCGKCKDIQFLCRQCELMRDEIKQRHISKPCWKNTDIEKWSDCPNSHWFIAQCYMNDGQAMVSSARDYDISALLNFIINCKWFKNVTKYGHIQINARKVRTIRNTIIHNGRQNISYLELLSCADSMLELLKDDTPVGKLKGNRDAETAQTRIKDILKVSFVITLEDEIKVKFSAHQRKFNEIEERLKLLDRTRQEDIQHFQNMYSEISQVVRTVQELKTNPMVNTSMLEKILKTSNDITSKDVIYMRLSENIDKRHTPLQHMDSTHPRDHHYLLNKSNIQDKGISQIVTEGMEQRTDAKHTKNTFSLKKRVEIMEQSIQALNEKVEEGQLKQDADFQELAGKIITLLQPTEKASEIHTKRPAESDNLKKLKDRTESRLGARIKLEYIPTSQAAKAKRLLESKNYVLIKGNPGEGKTTMALHLIDQDNFQGRRVFLSSPRDWEDVVTDWVDIVVIEDIFGQFDLDSDRLQDWIVHLPTLQEYVLSRKLKLIITSRVDILTKAYSKIRLCKLFCDALSVILSSEQLNRAEKMIILNSELLRNNKTMTRDEKEQCIKNISGLIGFPQCCSLFAGHLELFDRGPEFFKSPEQVFVETITMLDEARFFSLAFLFCNGETMEEHLSPDTMPEPSKRLFADLATHLHISDTNVSIQELRDSYNSFIDLYTMKSMSCIKFAHATVFEAVGQVLADRCVEMVVKYCDSEYLYQRTYTDKAKDSTSQNVFLHVAVYGLLAERMVCDIIDDQFVRSVAQHSALRQHSFLIKLKEELIKVNRVNDFFTAKPYNKSIFEPPLSALQDVVNKVHMPIAMFNIRLPLIYCNILSEGECSTFMQFVLQSDEDVVQLVYSQLLELLACAHTNNSSDCWKCKEKQSLLELALYYQRFQIADELITMGATFTHLSLCNAARHGDLKRVQTILHIMKMSRTFNPESVEAKYALCRAYTSGNQSLVELLLNETVKLNSIYVTYAVQHGDLNVLMKIVEHLKSHNNWNPNSEHSIHKKLFPPFRCFGNISSYSIRPVFSALYMTLSEGKFQMAKYLINNYAGLTLDLLVYLSGSGSHQAVTKLIQYFKAAGIWNPHSYCASKALEHAYIAQNFEIFDLLVHNGVSFTIQSIAVIMVYYPSLKSVKKVIQHLKDTDNWDFECDDASEALEISWNLNTGVCDLLIQEGVTLRMNNFPGVVKGVSLESAKKAIEHLKATGNWDCNCDEASKALEISYGQADYDVQDLLVMEGVTLKMKNFPASVKSVMKAIQHLKVTDNWDSTCEYASKALENAYIEHKHDAVDLLIAEKVTLTMKNLPGVLAANVSVTYIKQVIELLKSTDNWDSKCHDASKALSIAYIKNETDKCDLLTDENVTLTMTNLPFAMVHRVSLECIKKLIQRLKYTDNWDSTCQDASNALEIAYEQHNNDVCDMLVQEGVILQMNNLPGTIMGSLKSLRFVENAIENLKDTGNWDCKCDDASKALVAACIREQFDTFDMLARERVELSMVSLQYIIMSLEVPLGSMTKAIQHLKDINKWDCKSLDAINALVIACCLEKYDVCDILVQEGVTLTMKHLLYVAMIASSESVTKVIQYLKQTDNWDSKCNYATTVLMVSYVKEMYDVCVILAKEGISLTMTNLAVLVAVCASSVSVKKAVEHLKDNKNWHCTCDDALLTIVIAYRQQKYNVCSVLFEAGLSLTMNNLPALLFNSPLASFKRCIQDMKNTNNWNSMCDDASNSLIFMYIHQKYEACALMTQEGVTLEMKDFPTVVAFCASLKPVKKAIRHLKVNGNWDCNCECASDALLIAFSQQKDALCEMLIQMGLSLKMKHLFHMVYNISLEAVQSALKHLKDKRNCGSEYDVALQVLESVYGKQNYSSFYTMALEVITLALQNNPAIVWHVSLEPTKKVIQHLKETNNWDCTCKDGLKALVTAYCKQRYDVCDMLVQEGLAFTMKNLPWVVANSTAFESVKKALEYLKDGDNWDFTCNDARNALVIAYSQQKYDVCALLVQEQVILTMEDLIAVVGNSASIESVNKAIQHLKDNCKWDSTCDDARKALVIGYSQQKYNVCALMVQEQVMFTVESLPAVVANSVSLDPVKKAIQNLMDSDNWDFTCNDARNALVIAYSQQKYDVCALLVQEQVILTMEDLIAVVGNSASIESVNKAIQHLKDNCKWDSTCDDARKALVIGYSQQKYNVCALMVQEQVMFTVESLPAVVANSVSLDPVKKAIQHLMDSDNWDFTCNDARKALVIAYSQQKYDVCALLVQEQVMFTGESLPAVVANSVSLDPVKKAIQHLMDSDNWDFTCNDARNALVIAYSQQKYDVCALLVQEQVILTMEDLIAVVGNSASIESVNKAIQHLKDNGKWDSKCDDARKALVIAYSQQKYDVCALLVQEQVMFTEESLPAVVANSVSLYPVKKAIQHLMDGDNWDFTCNDARNALVIAYSQQRFDVCALLVQEQVLLTMEDLIGVVGNSASIESVNKAIQHLKDNGKWDSKCDDARKALVIAYSQQKYDVCALLVQEQVMFIEESLPAVVANSVSLDPVKKAIQNLMDGDNWDFTCNDARNALVIAYSQQRFDVCALLVQEQVLLTMEDLIGVVGNSASIESVNKAIQHLKDNGKWDSKCDDARKALVIAYSQQKYDVCALLVQEQVMFIEESLPAVVANSVSLDPVKKAIQNLMDSDNWDFTCNDARNALVIAYSQQRFDVCALLVQEQVLLTMEDLIGVVGNSASIESVNKAIQHLKDNGKWDSKCDDARKALVIAYSQQKYDVCALLVQEQIMFIEESLPAVVANSVSLDPVKKAIQNLMDSDNWDFTCNDARNALVIAYSQQRFDVCALLVEEQVLLTMEDLIAVVGNSASIESVNKAIQHLKDNGKWDSTCDDARKAIVIAYSQQKYDVCALMVREQVMFTGESLPAVVANSVSLDPVKKAIQHLMNSDKWDCTCNYARRALVIAYSQQRYDVCALLVQEQVILTMEDLFAVVGNSASIESVNKAIQHLKDNGKWDSTCDDARKALVIAYSKQKYDVCALLVQEKIIFTMQSLPAVIANSLLLDSVEKAMQDLKDNDKWDSTCDDAHKSLVIAYSQQRYDVCALLTQEEVRLTMQSLPAIVGNSKLSESVMKAIQDLKDSNQWDVGCCDGFRALIFACTREMYDVFAKLVQEGINLTMQSLPNVVANRASLASVKTLIRHLKQTSVWDIYKGDFALRATHIAFQEKQYDVHELLVFEEFILTMENLPDLVEYSSLQTVEKAIQYLKDTCIWDYISVGASRSLEIAFINQKYDVCELLVREKVKLRMKNLPGIVDCKFVESVKMAIQHLKDFNNWDSKCHDASKAMEIAWKQNCDICDLLVQESVTLTMENLPGLVNSVSLDYLQKAIQHLKDNNNWDSKCDEASKALEIAWYQTYDVCNWLLHEGVTLAMPNLLGVVINSKSVEPVKTAIQHLQDNSNWDSNCYDAQRALEFAYRLHNNDVCDILFAEKAALIMANFPGVVSDLSLNDVKKAIQHLKDNNNWHPKSNDASTALEIAYIKKKYDVIDILVQEGFTLTMMNLPGVVMCQSVHYVNKAIQHLKYTNMWDSKCDCAAAALEVAYKLDMNDAFGLLSQDGVTLKISCLPDLVLSESFESVTKLIQLLKETNNWNPKCEDASRALENAYIKQKYSVCDLLVMEGVALTMKNFPTVVDHMSWKTTEKAMEHLKQNNAWDPKSDHAEKALEIALSKQNYDVFDLLVEKGVTLAMKNIPGVVGCVSLLSAQKAVQLLKCNSNWDSKCNDASKALEIGWKYTYLLDLLVTNGVTLTMKCLPLIVFHVSWESANKAIQHLKDNKNWNFNSEYASEALEAAYTKQKYNMIDVLVQEGVKLTMKNISRIVDIAQLTLIQKAVQHLKDSNSWDPKCDHASHSLQISLRKHKYTVFDLLVHEGVVLTMKHFPGVVESNSMMSVKKAIQYLKDTDKWDPNCADAIRALEIAWKHKCNLYDLLVQEEEILPMQDLPGVIDTVSYKDVDQHVRFIYSIMKPQ